MKDKLMESKKNYYHLRRIPSVSVRDKENSPCGGQWRPVDTRRVPQRISSQASPLCGTVKDAHWSFLSENAREDNPRQVHFHSESSAGNNSSL